VVEQSSSMTVEESWQIYVLLTALKN
jgi:hypothetical protein